MKLINRHGRKVAAYVLRVKVNLVGRAAPRVDIGVPTATIPAAQHEIPAYC
jgi:hypothetical protein